MRGRITAIGAALLLSTASASAAQEEDFRWSGRLAPGQRIEVRGIAGDVTATLATGAETEVVARKSGRESDFDAVRVEVLERADAVVVCVIYDSRNTGSSCNQPGEGDDDEDRSNRNLEVSVDFEVRVPAGVELVGSTVSGDVSARGLRSDVRASTVSGSVLVSTTGVARGRTVSGDVNVEMGSLDWSRLDFETVSGDIVVALPADLAAEVEFESLSGELESEFQMTVERRRDGFVGSELSGRIGDGGRHLRLHTISGDVRLRRTGAGGR